jgi:Protein of unknown function (DUF4233)
VNRSAAFPPSPASPATRRLAASVLAGEAVVLLFFVLAASRLYPDDAGRIAAAGLAIAAAALLLCAALRFPWAFWAGWVLQLVLITTGVVVPVMFLLGAIFAALWYGALRLGATVSQPPAGD